MPESLATRCGSMSISQQACTIAAEIEVTRQLALQCMLLSEQGKVPVHEAAIVKVLASEVTQRMGEAALDIAGTGAILGEGSEGAKALFRCKQALLHKDQPGWRILRRVPTMGPEELGGTCELDFDGLEIPEENRLMEEGDEIGRAHV